MLKGEKDNRHGVSIISTRCRFYCVHPLVGGGRFVLLYLICNIFSLLLHNFNVLGVNTVTTHNTILYFMGFKPLLGGVLIVVHIWAILGFQYKFRITNFHLYYYLLGSVTCSHTTDFLERNTAIC